MPLEREEDLGTEADGSKNMEYCHFCYQRGEFTEPEITMEQMVERIIGITAKMRGISMEEARKESKEFIPRLKQLKRWQK